MVYFDSSIQTKTRKVMKKEFKSTFDESTKKHVVFYRGSVRGDFYPVEALDSKEDADKAIVYYTTQQNCKECGGSGRIYWGDSSYICSHGLTPEQSFFNGVQR